MKFSAQIVLFPLALLFVTSWSFWLSGITQTRCDLDCRCKKGAEAGKHLMYAKETDAAESD